MSADWSLTYLKTDASLDAVFDSVVSAFYATLANRLYETESHNGEYVNIKLETMIVEKFDDAVRAQIIVDSLILEFITRGIILYPQMYGLYTMADSVNVFDTLYAGRERRSELVNRSEEWQSILLFMNFIANVTQRLKADASHILHSRTPAGTATGVHFFRSGEFIDDYYWEEIEGTDGKVELPQKPDELHKLLDGRFAFLTLQPQIDYLYNAEETFERYFVGEDLATTEVGDIFKLRASNLYVPFWDEHAKPFGAVYCPTKDFPSYLERRSRRE